MKLRKMCELRDNCYANIFYKTENGLISVVGRRLRFGNERDYYFKIDQHQILRDNDLARKGIRARGWLPLRDEQISLDFPEQSL